MARKKSIKADDNTINENSSIPVIGTYEGECADANITNNNGLDITRDVWEYVFNSDDYKQGIDKGWYIGYLGHPEDPGCMDFKDACIVMTEGHINDDGKVFGKFNLIDTPVGRIVKTFQEAGVQFGVSVRGAGDIVNNSVDPETFVFRGFDIVTFPAFPESIPTFTSIAASTDIEEKKKYDKICASVKSELNNIDSCETIDFIQSQFPEQSEVYDELENRKCELGECEEELALPEPTPEERIELLEAQVEGLTQLLQETILEREYANNSIYKARAHHNRENILMSRKLHTIARIVAGQNRDLEDMENIYNSEIKKAENKAKTAIRANTELKTRLETERNTNLSYKKKINSYRSDIKDKEEVICSLQEDLDKTVANISNVNSKVSNLEAENKSLRQSITASEKVIEEYQDAYASLYSKMLGIDLGDNVAINASTTVGELQSKITASSSITKIMGVVDDSQFVEVEDDDDYGLVVC